MREILTNKERQDIYAMIEEARKLHSNLVNWMEDHLDSAFQETKITEQDNRLLDHMTYWIIDNKYDVLDLEEKVVRQMQEVVEKWFKHKRLADEVSDGG